MSDTLYWISTVQANREFLESLDIELGPYNGVEFDNCKIPEDAFEDLYDVWGLRGDEVVCFGPMIRPKNEMVRGSGALPAFLLETSEPVRKSAARKRVGV